MENLLLWNELVEVSLLSILRVFWCILSVFSLLTINLDSLWQTILQKCWLRLLSLGHGFSGFPFYPPFWVIKFETKLRLHQQAHQHLLHQVSLVLQAYDVFDSCAGDTTTTNRMAGSAPSGSAPSSNSIFGSVAGALRNAFIHTSFKLFCVFPGRWRQDRFFSVVLWKWKAAYLCKM